MIVSLNSDFFPQNYKKQSNNVDIFFILFIYLLIFSFFVVEMGFHKKNTWLCLQFCDYVAACIAFCLWGKYYTHISQMKTNKHC